MLTYQGQKVCYEVVLDLQIQRRVTAQTKKTLGAVDSNDRLSLILTMPKMGTG